MRQSFDFLIKIPACKKTSKVRKKLSSQTSQVKYKKQNRLKNTSCTQKDCFNAIKAAKC